MLQAMLLFRYPRVGLLADVVAIFPIGNALSFVLAYSNVFQFLIHTAIAVNRFVVITSKHNAVSKTKGVSLRGNIVHQNANAKKRDLGRNKSF